MRKKLSLEKKHPDVDFSFPFFELTEEERRNNFLDYKRFRTRLQCARVFDILPEVRIAETLYFKGGKMSDYGYKIRENINPWDAFTIILMILKHPEANHIQKEAMAGLAIYNWYDVT